MKSVGREKALRTLVAVTGLDVKEDDSDSDI